MDFDLNEWVKLVLRWIHVFASIMWVGTTYFFTWLDGRFSELTGNSTKAGTPAGEQDKHVWMVHSGGFYVVEKQKVPKVMPEKLHWFRWEAANAWMRILPAQRRMVAALKAGQEPNQTEALRAKTCSKHNTFLVVPVVFIMISKHFPTVTYGSRYNWAILSALVLAGWWAAKV